MNVDRVPLTRIWGLGPEPDGFGPGEPAVELVAPTRPVGSAFAIGEAALASVGAAVAAGGEFGALSAGDGPASEPSVIDGDHALAAWTGSVAVDGERPPAWAPLSGFYRAADDRFVQLHCNFPHHAAGVARRLGVAEEREEFEAAIAGWNAFELEEALRADGMICAAYRTMSEWADHPHAVATADLPLIEFERLGDAEPRPPTDPHDRPLDGINVLDCSRVLAGPVCGQTLAAQGAQVLRVGAAHLPAVEVGVLSTGFGKRNAFVDLDTDDGRATFAELLAGADVFVDAYRPGTLAGKGFSAERAAELSPGIVVVEVCAFDWTGPWAGRRGFDSIVQSTTGLALAQADLTGSPTPVHLPVQALDYATGYLAAAAAARLLTLQRRRGGSWRARLSLLRTRNWLVGLGGPHPFDPAPAFDASRFLHTVDSAFGAVTAVRPVVGRWDLPPSRLGSAEPRWS